MRRSTVIEVSYQISLSVFSYVRCGLVDSIMPMTLDDDLFDALVQLSQPGPDLVSQLNNNSDQLSRETDDM